MKILFISLGCDKNLVDTEVMLGMLASRGCVQQDPLPGGILLVEQQDQ